MNIPFIKMQGLGNDFVVIDETSHTYALTTETMRKIADRHFGIGCDQILLIKTSTHPKADFDYLIFNADGTQAEQCGNGARCVAHYLYTQKNFIKPTLFLNTLGGIIEIILKDKHLISVNMGTPQFAPADIPMQLHSTTTQYTLSTVDDTAIHFGAVNIGNPHIVVTVDHVQNAPVSELGSYLSHHPAFPVGVNVGFMEVINPHLINLRVYERGAGETLACGTGASAAAVIGQTMGLLSKEVRVELPGGVLHIHWEGPNQPIWMTGPAEIVFTGHWPISIN